MPAYEISACLVASGIGIEGGAGNIQKPQGGRAVIEWLASLFVLEEGRGTHRNPKVS